MAPPLEWSDLTEAEHQIAIQAATAHLGRENAPEHLALTWGREFVTEYRRQVAASRKEAERVAQEFSKNKAQGPS